MTMLGPDRRPIPRADHPVARDEHVARLSPLRGNTLGKAATSEATEREPSFAPPDTYPKGM
jgi:hypothetical protein